MAISDNTTTLQAILDSVNALPDAGGGSGGGSVETCTILIYYPGASDEDYPTGASEEVSVGHTSKSAEGLTSTLLVGSKLGEYDETLDKRLITLSDVVCGSLLAILDAKESFGLSFEAADNAEELFSGNLTWLFRAPATAGATATITF